MLLVREAQPSRGGFACLFTCGFDFVLFFSDDTHTAFEYAIIRDRLRPSTAKMLCAIAGTAYKDWGGTGDNSSTISLWTASWD